MRYESETTANVSLCLFLCAGARGDFLFLDFNGIGRRRADCPRYNFSFSVNMASDAGRLCENSCSDGELPSADFRCLKRLLAALASCCVFVRGPRFCFSVHSVFSTLQAKFPRIMRSFRFRFRRTFRFIRTARTVSDRTTRGTSFRRIAAVLPPFFRFLFPCRFRFHVSLWQKAQSAAHA